MKPGGDPYVDLDGKIGYASPTGDGCPECLRSMHDSLDPKDHRDGVAIARHNGVWGHCAICRPLYQKALA